MARLSSESRELSIPGWIESVHQSGSSGTVLSNLFMHYADDAVVHCASEKQAIFVRDSIERRLRHFGLNLHPGKTQIVYCKQEGRDRDYPITEFTFLGFTFRRRPRRSACH